MSRTLVQSVDNAVLLGRRGKIAAGSAPFDAKLVISKGQALARVTSAAVNHWQTITATSGSAGSAVFDYDGQRFTLAYNASAAAAQAAIAALPNVGTGNVVVSGTTLDAGALTVKFQGKLAGLTQPTILLVSNGITGATPAIATSQTPIPGGRMVAWNPAVIAQPAIGTFTATGTGSSGSWGAGTHLVQLTWSTALGETLPTIPYILVLTATQSIRIAAVNAANTPDDALYLNVYVNGTRVHRITVSTPGTSGSVAQTATAPPRSGSGQPLPTVNTAYTATDGRHILAGFAKRAFTTDNFGRVYTSSVPMFDNGALGKPEAEIVLGGTFLGSDLSGISGYEQLFLDQLRGRLVSGVLAASNAEYWFGPEGD